MTSLVEPTLAPSLVDNAPTLGAAWRYAACGLVVFPVAYRDKKPHGGYRWGVLRTPQPMDAIERLFPPAPTLNVGVICGPPSGGLVVLDVDGRLALENILNAYPPLAETWVVRTGRTEPGPGYHVYVRVDGPTPTITGGAFRDELGLDVKGTGSYVVAPPSIHISGWEYTWERGEPERIAHVGDARTFLTMLLRGLGVTA